VITPRNPYKKKIKSPILVNKNIKKLACDATINLIQTKNIIFIKNGLNKKRTNDK
jgi:hypothetical protein